MEAPATFASSPQTLGTQFSWHAALQPAQFSGFFRNLTPACGHEIELSGAAFNTGLSSAALFWTMIEEADLIIIGRKQWLERARRGEIRRHEAVIDRAAQSSLFQRSYQPRKRSLPFSISLLA